MANEDLTTYTEVDSAGDITVTPDTVAMDTMRNNAVSWVVDDKGADHFAGALAFEHLFDLDLTAGDGATMTAGVLANIEGTRQDIIDASEDSIGTQNAIAPPNVALKLEELDGGSSHVDSKTIIVAHYWFRFSYNPLVGSFGTITLLIYSDSDRTVLVDTQSVTLHSSVKSYRYNHAIQSIDVASSLNLTGTFNNYDLQEAIDNGPQTIGKTKLLVPGLQTMSVHKP